MKRFSQILMFIAAALLLLLFAFPIWSIELVAPQYPEGLSLYIWINKITGSDEFTLFNINMLNHYIGMKAIEPSSIPELTYFPYIIGGMTFLGFIFAFIGNHKLFLAWGIIAIVLGVLGIYDFYLWEYDYGHNLDPHAAIKVPGMAYQPPLFGEKWLLNFLAKSYPALGTYAMAGATCLSLIAFWIGKKKK